MGLDIWGIHLCYHHHNPGNKHTYDFQKLPVSFVCVGGKNTNVRSILLTDLEVHNTLLLPIGPLLYRSSLDNSSHIILTLYLLNMSSSPRPLVTPTLLSASTPLTILDALYVKTHVGCAFLWLTYFS